MSGYDEMTTDELRRLALGPRPLKAVAVALADRLAEAEQKLATYEPIVQSLIDYGEPIADYAGQCGCCGMGQPRHGSDWRHAADCPWLLAQRALDL